MWYDQTHPSDETLLLAIDRELSVSRQIALDRHLSDCERCRARSSAMASVADETSRLRLLGETAPSTAALRRRLQGDMTERGARWNRSVSFRMGKAFATLPVMIRVGAAVALIGVVLTSVRSTRGIVSVATPIEAASLPIRALTPGATADLDRDALCAGRLPARSPIAAPVRQAVLRQYQMEHVPQDEYELDYLITPELGGTNDPQNLWPERYASGVWNARVKDDLERLLPQLVCQGTLDLATAQQAIADNWIVAYKKYVGTDPPIEKQGKVMDDDDERETNRPRVSFAASFESDISYAATNGLREQGVRP
jgi:anti-sigma factor RsiW